MLKRFFHWRIRAFERRYDYDASYMHEIVDIDSAGLIQLQRLTGIGQHHGGLPLEALAAARLAAALHEDCGPCVQIVVNIALEAGVQPKVLQSLASNSTSSLPKSTVLAFRFAQAVLNNSHEVNSLRAEVEDEFGPNGPFCFGLALSIARIYPVIKRAMGHAHTCSQVSVAGNVVATAGH